MSIHSLLDPGLSRLFGLSGLFGLFRLFGFGLNETNQTNHINQINKTNQTDHARSEKGAKVSTTCADREETLSDERDACYKRPGSAERARSLIDQHLNTNHAIWTLARIVHEGLSRNGGVARDKRIRDTRYPKSRISHPELRVTLFPRVSLESGTGTA